MAHRIVENSAFAAFAGRIIRAHGRRVAEGDPYALAELVELRGKLDEAIAEGVAGLRAEPHCYSASEIASALGVTRQAVTQRWPRAKPARRPGGQPGRLR